MNGPDPYGLYQWGSGQCPVCFNSYALRKDGTMRQHRLMSLPGPGEVCPGSGNPPLSDPVAEVVGTDG